VENRLYLHDLYQTVTESAQKYEAKKPFYDLQMIPSPVMQQEMEEFIRYRASQVALSTLYGERQFYIKMCTCLQTHAKKTRSFHDQSMEQWMQLKGWMQEEGIAITQECRGVYGNVNQVPSKLVCYLNRVLKWIVQKDNIAEQEKDIWALDQLDIPIQKNPIKNFKTINFTQIVQPEVRKEFI